MPDDTEIKFKGERPLLHMPKRNKDNPLIQNAVLIDEASMIGQALCKQLLDALPSNGTARFFGDNNQLPPVEDEYEAPFRKMILNKPTAWLTFNYRSEDAIISNALRVLDGKIPTPNAQFQVIYSEKPLHAMLRLADLTFISSNAQIITPTRRGIAGTIRANPFLQMKFNPRGDYLKLDRLNSKEEPIVVRAGDKFLWVKNDYNFNMFNGEIGTIDGLDDESGELMLGMPDRKPLHIPPMATGSGPYGTYLYDPRKQIELGYAATTHKAQGSEFNDVIYYMSSAQPFLLNRNNFYTAITRAKRFCVVICDRRAMRLSISRRI